MPKGKRGKPPEDKPRAEAEVIQFQPPVVPPAGSDMAQELTPAEALRVLGELNDRALEAHKSFRESSEETKQRKAKWDELTLQVQSKLRELTHPVDLPLFNEFKAEEDLRRIQEAAGAPTPAHVLADEQIPF